uniref:9DC3 n=1 Tax=Solanum tuberosum TaxID=4113 RepID=M1A8Q7_SOLTU
MDYNLIKKSFEAVLQNLINLESNSLRTIVLNGNFFEGIVPMSLLKCDGLEVLDVGSNAINDTFPAWLGTLQELQELTTLNFLEILNLSQNLLVGCITQGSQFNTFENDLYGCNLDLCGPPLSKQCGTSDRPHVPQSLEEEADEDESYFLSGFTWESVVIGYSFGLVVGTIIWSLMFKYRKPKWFVEFFDGIMPP